MRLTVITILLFLNYLGLTQNADIGLSIGGSNYSGDLTENMAISIKQTHTCIGIHGRIELDPLISLKLQYMYLLISGDDKYSTRLGIINRQLRFQSEIHEINLSGQMQFLNLLDEKVRKWNPFLQLGISVFKFNPTTEYKGEEIALQPLGTEGQGMANYSAKYKLIGFALSMGFGLRYIVNSRYSLAMDAMWRQTSTDYLDDASTNYVSYEALLKNKGKMTADLGNKILADSGSQRANPADKDWYQSVVLTISYHFGKNNKFRSPSRRKYQILCPSF